MLAVLWPALAARLGAALDHRGTRRLAEFTIEGQVGTVIPLAGGWEVARTRTHFELRRGAAPRSADAAGAPAPLHGLGGAVLRWGGEGRRWRFTPLAESGRGRTAACDADVPLDTAWTAWLPAELPLTVRAWASGDRMRAPGGLRRRVKRFFRDAGIAGPDRLGWPVVVAGDEVVWIPGVRRSDAATERSGRPGLLYHCDIDHHR